MARKRNQAGRKPARPWRQVIDERVGKALSNSFRQQLLWILNERVASPSELARELGETLNKVCHHVKVLENATCIEVAFKRTVGNRVQTFYKATSRAFLDGAEWPKVPESLKQGLRATLLRNVLDDAIDAIVEETYDSADGSHMSWTPMILNEQGREETAAVLERALREIMEIQDRAKVDLASSGKAGTSYTVSILGYPSVLGTRTVVPTTDAQELAVAAESKGAKKTSAGKAKAARKSRAEKAPEKRRRKKRADS